MLKNETKKSTECQVQTVNDNYCRFCLTNQGNLIQICNCDNIQADAHRDCFLLFYELTQQLFCEVCEQEFRLNNSIISIQSLELNKDDKWKHEKNTKLWIKLRFMLSVIRDNEMICDEFYYTLSSIVDIFIVTLFVWIIFYLDPFKSADKRWPICKDSLFLPILIYLTIFLWLKYCFNIFRIKELYYKIEQQLIANKKFAE